MTKVSLEQLRDEGINQIEEYDPYEAGAEPIEDQNLMPDLKQALLKRMLAVVGSAQEMELYARAYKDLCDAEHTERSLLAWGKVGDPYDELVMTEKE